MMINELKKKNGFITYPKAWIKNKRTREIKWFESISGNAEDAAARHWAFFDYKDKIENLGNSFFDTKTYDYLDNAQIYKQQKEYLLQVSLKINRNSGVKNDPYINITFEYLCSLFLGDTFANGSHNNSDLPGVIWGYGGGGVMVEKKFVKGLISFTAFNLFDSFMSSQNVGLGSDMSSKERAEAVDYFNNRTKSYIDNEILFQIKLHNFNVF